MKYGLDEKTIEAIHRVLGRHKNIAEAILYGSRAKGTHKNSSDIDLTLKGRELMFTEQVKIENELDDLLLPYKIDLSIYHQIDNPDLTEHIARVGVVFYKR